MTRARQVRLEPDVVALIEGDPDLARLSLSGGANEAIRWALRDVEESSLVDARPDPGPISRPEARRPVVVSVRDLARRSRGARSGRPDPRSCPHPPGRAVGNRCGLCGGSLT